MLFLCDFSVSVKDLVVVGCRGCRSENLSATNKAAHTKGFCRGCRGCRIFIYK